MKSGVAQGLIVIGQCFPEFSSSRGAFFMKFVRISAKIPGTDSSTVDPYPTSHVIVAAAAGFPWIQEFLVVRSTQTEQGGRLIRRLPSGILSVRSFRISGWTGSLPMSLYASFPGPVSTCSSVPVSSGSTIHTSAAASGCLFTSDTASVPSAEYLVATQST